MRVGVIRNRRSHHNQAFSGPATPDLPADALLAEPATPQDLDDALAAFASAGVDLLVIDGGDGTVRDVLSRLPEAFAVPPRLAIVPSGKTNALALDLGARPGWTAAAAAQRALSDPGSVKTRTPLEIRWSDQPERRLRGFVFGTGAYVRATVLAQKAHHLGVFNSAAVALTLMAAIARTLLGDARDPWRVGEPVSLSLDDTPQAVRARFLVLASTLKRFPLKARPFGPPSEGLKVLDVDAPPAWLWRAVATIVFGAEGRWLAKRGYRRAQVRSLRLTTGGDFVLDGDTYSGGDLTVTRGPALDFVVPA
jgi:hypothetical protein